MEGPALAWFQWMTRNHQLTTWASFLQAIEARFVQSPYEDPTGILFKLNQIGTVSEYLNQFEVLANRIVGLQPPLLLSCFVFELHPDIHREVQALQPLTLVHAARLARLQEDKLTANRQSHRPSAALGIASPSPPHGPNFYSPSSPTNSLSTPNPPLLPPPAKPPLLPLKRLTLVELPSRRERRLCFNCNEKFTRGHRCASRFFILIMDEDQAEPNADPNICPAPCPDNTPQPEPPQPDPPQAQISFCALLGHSAPETIRLLGRISIHNMVILVDGGSMHNFVQAHVIKHMGLPAQSTLALRVLVGNGNEIECHHLCPNARV